MDYLTIKSMPDKKINYTTSTVQSKDGTTISYRQLGKGPGVVLVHGGLEFSGSHMELAEALADGYTVYLPDRRGRGTSGPFGPDYSIEKEVEDLHALITKTHARAVFGLSSGAAICLQAALRLSEITKAVIYEPPLSIDGSFPLDWVRSYDQAVTKGDPAGALAIAMKHTQMLGRMPLPVWLLRPFLKKFVLRSKAAPGEITMRELIPTFHYDNRLLEDIGEHWRDFKDIQAEVLLMGGSRSPRFLKTALTALEESLPDVRRIDFSGLNHTGPSNKNMGGDPVRVAAEMKNFLGSLQ